MNDAEFHDTVIASLAKLEANDTARAETLIRLERVLIGNGQPGLVAKVASLEGRISAPKTLGIGASGGLFTAVAVIWLKQKLGIE